MSKKEELEKTIKDLQSALDKAQEELKSLDRYGRFIPEENEAYYYVDSMGDVRFDTNDFSQVDKQEIAFYNCFRTKEEAEREREKIFVRRQLEDIADRLNGGKKIDWGNWSQGKYCICFHCGYGIRRLELALSYDYQYVGAVYCLSDKFLEVAKKEIGEERLIKYIRWE